MVKVVPNLTSVACAWSKACISKKKTNMDRVIVASNAKDIAKESYEWADAHTAEDSMFFVHCTLYTLFCTSIAKS
jgi:peroxiredoxin